MTGWAALEQFLQTDPRDVGCEQALEVLHVYVELILDGATGIDATDAAVARAASRLPGVTAHLLACGPCAEDYRGLLAAAQADGR